MRFVFSKVTQGTTFVDDTYQQHTTMARNAGLLAGAYHFFDYTRNGTNQAKHYLDTLRSTTGLTGLLPLVVDVECLKSIGTSEHTGARIRLHALLDELYRQTGRYAMIYTSQYMWKRVVGAPTSFGKYPLWVACWKCNNIYMPRGWTDWLFWQAGQFKFSGGLKLDGNVYSSNLRSLKSQKQRAVKIERGAMYAASQSVEADLRGVDGDEVRVAIDDGPWGAWQPYATFFGLQLADREGSQNVRLQLRSFRGVNSPVFSDDIVLDSEPPTVDGPNLALRSGWRVPKSGAWAPVGLAMTATDAGSGLASSLLKATCDGRKRAGRFVRLASAEVTARLDQDGCAVLARGRDKVGHSRKHRLSPNIEVIDARRGTGKIAFGAGWSMAKHRRALKGTLARTTQAGAKARVTFDGAEFAIVVRRGPSGGKLEVRVDGRVLDTIDTYAPKFDNRRVAYVADVPRGKHTLKLRATGTGSAASTGSTIWLDGVLVLDRVK